MANKSKKFIASIYLFNKQAVKSLTDKTVIDQDPVSLACKYSDLNVDEIIVFDMSEGGSDADHEAALDMIKDISKAVDVDVTGSGNAKRMEDIKKLLYAGCKKACVDFSKQGNIDILQEVSEKFGKEKIAITCTDAKQVLDNAELSKEFASEVILLADDDLSLIDKARDISSLTLTVLLTENAVSRAPYTVFEDYDYVDGITGNLVNCNIDKIDENKNICIEKSIPICRLEAVISWDELKKNSDGLIPVIVQDYRTDQVLMLAYMNEEAYNKTQTTGKMTYFSRSRSSLWLKGETSGHFQYVKALYADCDKDTILAKVKQIGAACHTGSYSCFFNEIARKDYTEKNPQKVLDSVFDVIKDRQVNPKVGSYTNYLFDKGIDKILKKVGEEATEMVIAAKNPNSNEIVYEMSDFLYHMMVLMAEKNISWEEITDELSRR